MSQVTLWLEIKEHREGGALFGSTRELMVKVLETDFLPRAEDRIHILRSTDPEDTEWTVEQDVKCSYWEGDGSVHVSMRPIFLDPPEEWQTNGGPRYESAWYTEIDGDDLIERLLASGWVTYETWKEANR